MKASETYPAGSGSWYSLVMFTLLMLLGVLIICLMAGAATGSVVEQTLERLKPEEGFRAKPYLDSEGIMTIGFGTNIGEGISRMEAEYLLRERLTATHDSLTKVLPWLSTAPDGQQSAILDMGYQLGPHGLLGFSRHALRSGSWRLSSGQGCRARFGLGAGDS